MFRNIICEDLPSTISVQGKDYHIYTDFRDWMELYELLLTSKNNMEVYAYICDLFIDEFPEDIDATLQSIAEFLNGNKLSKRKGSSINKNQIVFSYSYDAAYILGAFLECYGIDLYSINYMHWWKFNALFDALNESCELKQRIYYRSLNMNDVPKEQRAQIQKIKANIAIPSSSLLDDEIAAVFL